MKKDEMFNKKLADRLNTCITDKFKTNADFIRELNRQHGFPVNNTRQGECFILESRLNQILKGKKDKAGKRHFEKLDYNYALGFSKVLGVPVEYLMGEIDYPSKKAEENAMWLDALSKWSKEDQERIETVKRVMTLLSDRQFKFFFGLKETYEAVSPLTLEKYTAHAEIYSINMQHSLIDNGMHIIPDTEFYEWLRFNTLSIPHREGDNLKVYTLSRKVRIIGNNNQWIELDINSFMHMIYDIDESIKATIQNRCDCWMKYANFDYKEALDKSFDPIT